MKRVLLVTAVLLGAISQVVAARTDPGQAQPGQRATGEPAWGGAAADLVSLVRIRQGLRPGVPPTLPSGVVRVSAAPPFDNLPVYRVAIVGYRQTTFRESLLAAVADRWPPARPGYLDGAPGLVSPAVPLVCVGVAVDPAFIVRAVQKWAHRRAVANAKREVAEELDAVLKARQAGANAAVSK